MHIVFPVNKTVANSNIDLSNPDGIDDCNTDVATQRQNCILQDVEGNKIRIYAYATYRVRATAAGQKCMKLEGTGKLAGSIEEATCGVRRHTICESPCPTSKFLKVSVRLLPAGLLFFLLLFSKLTAGHPASGL